ncbi:tyrosine-type recombinase/integrase [Acidithiobacillus ferrianus]|uniref:tyrosine-type recombinase/integrase n=1 Tax=Acidithiobacillus ferrianus TaxID=2678518 RepID=UPI0034E3A1DF
MASIEKRQNEDGSASYRVKIRIKGHPTATETFSRLTDAKQWASKTEGAIREKRHFPERQAQRKTLAEAIAKYKAEELPKLAQPQHRERHLSWWNNRLGAYHLSDVRPELINEHMQALAKETGPSGKPRAASTLRHYSIALTHLLNMAASKWGWIEHAQTDRVQKIAVHNDRVRFLDDDELPRLLDAVAPHEDLNLFVLLALGTGARAGELLSLAWQQVDMKSRSIRLTKTKNGDMRTLPIPAQALPLLAARVRRLDTSLVFPSRKDPLKPIVLRRAWLEALQAAGIENFKVHDLRHSAASYLVQGGASLLAVAELLGHRDLKITRRYSHLAPQHLRDVASRLDEKLGGAR